jgi:hypothetical protein
METCHPQSLQEEATSILEECRMVLPGIQALFGFQLIAVFNQGFHSHLQPAERWAHLCAMLLTVVAIVFVMGPAAYQRQAERHRITRGFADLSSRFVSAGMLALMLGMSVDVYVVGHVASTSVAASLAAAIGVALFAGGLWFGFPRWQAARRRRAETQPSRAVAAGLG